MTDDTLLLAGPGTEAEDGCWWLRAAPWNDGEGGPYEEVLVDLDGHVPAAFCWAEVVLVDETYLVVSIDPVETPRVGKKGGKLQLGGEPVEIEGAEENWLDSMTTGDLGRWQGRLVWLVDGGRAGWFAERRRREEQKRDQERRRHEQEVDQQMQDKHDGGLDFINPYTFVPLPPSVPRERPAGHERMAADRVSGWFDWTLTMRTQLLLWQEQTELVTELTYPGSSLRGVLRSLHETLTGSCLRVVDTDYTPVHREPMNAFRPAQDRLAVVERVNTAGRVTAVRLCDEVVWVNVENLRNLKDADGCTPYSGMRITVDTRGAKEKLGRTEQHQTDAVRVGGDWVLHLTDRGARFDKKQYFAATGRVGDQVVEVPGEVWERYRGACAGGAGLREDASDKVPGCPPDASGRVPGCPTSDKVPGHDGWPGQEATYQYERDPKRTITPGRFRKADGWLAVGDTVWVSGDVRSGRFDLKMAAIWRRHGSHPVSERLAGSLQPCSDPDLLCPSCRVFGSVDPSAGAGSQSGYASHIRVGPGLVAQVSSDRVKLPPLRSPHPSAGGMYLRHDQVPASALKANSKDESHVVAAHWGSKADQARGGPRPVAGRKYYWHGQDNDAHGRHTVRETPDNQQGSAVAVGTGTTLTARVWFDNLSLDELAMLLAAADPTRALGDGPYAIHLGRGKPLGYGTATTQVSNLVAQTAAQRYGGEEGEQVSLDDLLPRSRAAGDDERLQECWEGLRQVLRLDAVSADRIWYPTTGSFCARRTTKERVAFDRSFAWFAQHSGARFGDLLPLPRISEPDQYLTTMKQDESAPEKATNPRGTSQRRRQ